jgi:LPS-assembly protein
MEVLTWRVAQARFFDPTFGGAVLPGQVDIGFRNVVLAESEFSPIAFLDGPRTYSPVASSLTISPYNFLSFDYRTEYDPLRRRFIDHTISGTFRYSKYFASLGDTAITTNPLLVPQANQMSVSGGYGSANRRGWNAAALVDFDVLLNRRLFNFFQVSYNTDCCGFSMQLRQYNLGIRNENQYLFSFSLANIGTFGSLQKQSRLF